MEKDKKRKYNTRIQDVERGTFTPIVLGATGGMAREASIFYSHLAERLAEKRNESKSDIITTIRRKIAFTLLRSMVACLRGERSSRQFNKNQLLCEDAAIEAQIHSLWTEIF